MKCRQRHDTMREANLSEKNESYAKRSELAHVCETREAVWSRVHLDANVLWTCWSLKIHFYADMFRISTILCLKTPREGANISKIQNKIFKCRLDAMASCKPRSPPKKEKSTPTPNCHACHTKSEIRGKFPWKEDLLPRSLTLRASRLGGS